MGGLDRSSQQKASMRKSLAKIVFLFCVVTQLSLAFSPAKCQRTRQSFRLRTCPAHLATSSPRRRCHCHQGPFRASPTESEERIDTDKWSSASILVAIPALSLLFPALIQAKLVVPLLIVKRVYIYLMAATVLTVASVRGVGDDPSLGTRLVQLTREILPYFQKEENVTDPDKRFQEMLALDDVEGATQAVSLPLIVASSLAFSLLLVGFQGSDFGAKQGEQDPPVILQTFVTLLPQISFLLNALVITLFSRAELARTPFFQSQQALVTVLAIALSVLAYLGPPSIVWPIQNLLCMCLAVFVARAIQLPRLNYILFALSGLVIYDVVSVGIQLVNLGSASIVAAQQQGGERAIAAASASSSAMGAVAMSKVGFGTSPAWQPGLFEVRLKGIVTDLLGLGDAVFPSLLSTFCYRFDEESGESSYFALSIAGFAVGCIACEFAPGISGSGLPALLFLVPAMLVAILGTAAVRGDLPSLWSFDATSSGKN